MLVGLENCCILFSFKVVKKSVMFYCHRFIGMKQRFDASCYLFWVWCLFSFSSLSSFSYYFGILKGGVFFFKHLHLCIYVFHLVVHGLDPWDTLYPAVFFLRKNGPHIQRLYLQPMLIRACGQQLLPESPTCQRICVSQR